MTAMLLDYFAFTLLAIIFVLFIIADWVYSRFFEDDEVAETKDE